MGLEKAELALVVVHVMQQTILLRTHRLESSVYSGAQLDHGAAVPEQCLEVKLVGLNTIISELLLSSECTIDKHMLCTAYTPSCSAAQHINSPGHGLQDCLSL